MTDPSFLPALDDIARSPIGGFVLQQLVSWAGQRIPNLLEDPVLRAVDETVGLMFGDSEDSERLRSILRNWVQSKELRDLLTKGHRLVDQSISITELQENFENQSGASIQGLGITSQDILDKFIPCLKAEFSLRDKRYEAQNREFTRYEFTTLKDTVCYLVAAAERSEAIKADGVGKSAHEKIDLAKKLIESGQTSSAENVLVQLRNDASITTASAHFRIALNLGVCALRKDKYNDAEEEFATAKNLDGKSGIAWANLSQIAFLKSNFDSALKFSQKAMELDEQNSLVIATHILALSGSGKHDELSALIQQRPGVLEDYSCLIMLGQTSLDQKDYKEARAYFEKALSTSDGPTNPQAYFLLAQSRFAEAQVKLLADPPLPGEFNPEVSKELSGCIELISKAIEILKDRDDKHNLCKTLVNRGAVKALIGDTKAALIDCDLALFYEDSNAVALLNKARLLTLSGSFDEAESLLQKVADPYKGAARKLLADVYFQHGKLELAEQTFTAERFSNDPLFEQIATGRLLEISHTLGKKDEVGKLLAYIESQHAEDPDYIYMIAQQLRREGRFKEQIEFLTKALKSPKPELRNWLNWELARTYFDIGEYSKSAETYKSFVDLDGPIQQLIELTMSLYQAGNINECVQIARAIRLRGAKIPQFIEVEAKVLISQEKFDDAIVLFNELMILQPDDAWPKIYMAQVLMILGQKEKAKTLLFDASKQVLNGDEHAKIAVRQLLAQVS